MDRGNGEPIGHIAFSRSLESVEGLPTMIPLHMMTTSCARRRRFQEGSGMKARVSGSPKESRSGGPARKGASRVENLSK